MPGKLRARSTVDVLIVGRRTTSPVLAISSHGSDAFTSLGRICRNRSTFQCDAALISLPTAIESPPLETLFFYGIAHSQLHFERHIVDIVLLATQTTLWR